MNTDPTENIRREDQARINAEAAERAELVKQYGMVWSTNELREAFEVLGFIPLVTLSWPMNSLFFSRRTGRANVSQNSPAKVSISYRLIRYYQLI